MSKTGPREPAFTPFADGAAVRTVGALSFENGPAAIALHGTLDVTRDARGLAQARALKATVDAIVAALEAADLPADSPAEVAASEAVPTRVKNPFA